MPRTKKTEEIKDKPNTDSKNTKENTKEEFVFNSIDLKKENKQMSREERRALIDELSGISNKQSTIVKYTLEGTEYSPKQWVVCLTPDGYLYQEPVPRYCNYKTFVLILAAIPDRAIFDNYSIKFESEYFLNPFNMPGLDCSIFTCSTNGYRADNPYGEIFKIKNGTSKISGNLVFGGTNDGLSKSEVKELIKKIIEKIESTEF